jgi:hypothetical protein
MPDIDEVARLRREDVRRVRRPHCPPALVERIHAEGFDDAQFISLS